jgi:hypothetical protein
MPGVMLLWWVRVWTPIGLPVCLNLAFGGIPETLPSRRETAKIKSAVTLVKSD